MSTTITDITKTISNKENVTKVGNVNNINISENKGNIDISKISDIPENKEETKISDKKKDFRFCKLYKLNLNFDDYNKLNNLIIKNDEIYNYLIEGIIWFFIYLVIIILIRAVMFKFVLFLDENTKNKLLCSFMTLGVYMIILYILKINYNVLL